MAAASRWVFIGCVLQLHMFLIRNPSRQEAPRAEQWLMCLSSPPSRVSILGLKEKHSRVYGDLQGESAYGM